MRRLSALLTVLLLGSLVACSGPSEEPDQSSVAWGREVPQSMVLAGNDVTTDTSGPWTVRRTTSGRGRGSREAKGGDVEMEMLREEAPGADSAAPMPPTGGLSSGAGGSMPEPSHSEDPADLPTRAGPLKAGTTGGGPGAVG